MNISLLVPCLGSCLTAAYSLRGRLFRSQAAGSIELLPACLLIAWFVGLQLGQFTSSLPAMAWIAWFSLTAWVLILQATSPRVSLPPLHQEGWTYLDWLGFGFLTVVILAINGNDNICHYSIVATFLRGNIPPSALNDPSVPLAYHSLFDAGAAVLSAALGVDAELSLDLLSITCVAAVIELLGGISRYFFEDARTRQFSRLFFLFGLGPTYLRWARTLRWESTHGTSTQSFAEAAFRRPLALNFVLFLLLLGLLLPRLAGPSRTERGNPPAPFNFVLILIAFILPVTSEELTVFATGAILVLLAMRKVDVLSGAVWMTGLAAALPISGSFRALTHPTVGVAFPAIHVQLTPRLPSWSHPQHGIALFSWAGARTLFYEWGPIFPLALWISFVKRKLARVTLVPFIAISFLLPFGITITGWPRSDLDRFYFYGTAAGFFLAASLVEYLPKEGPWGGGSRARSRLLLALFTGAVILGPTVFLAGRVTLGRSSDEQGLRGTLNREAPQLRDKLARVGPKERIVTSVQMAQSLVLAGFVVQAPMSSNLVGRVETGEFESHLQQNGSQGDWYFLPASDPRVAGREVLARVGDYVLARAGSR